MRNLILIVFMLFLGKQLFAQNHCYPYVYTPSYTIPSHPLPTDSIQIVYTIGLPDYGPRLYKSVVMQNDTINIKACFYDAPTLVFGKEIDTIFIGILPKGTYIIRLTGYLSTRNDTCNAVYHCSRADTFSVGLVSGVIEDNNIGNFIIFPNPFTNHFTLQYDLPTARAISVDLYDMMGRNVYKQKAEEMPAGQNSLEINTPQDLPVGVYFVRVKDKSGEVVLKVVKE